MLCNFSGETKQWETLDMFPGYYFSEDGEVYSEKRHQLISQSVNHIGYLTATITDKNGYRAPRKIHRLVYQAFKKVELKPSDTIDHINNNKLNNKISNLQLLSVGDNVRKGKKDQISGKIIFTSQNVEKMCQLMSKQASPRNIFDCIGIDYDKHSYECDQLLKGLASNKAVYPEISNKYDLSKYKYNDFSTRNDNKITEFEAMDIYMNIMMNSCSQADLAAKYGITIAAVSNIKKKKNWKSITDWMDDAYFEQPKLELTEADIELENLENGLNKDYLKASVDNTINLKNEIQQALGC